LSRRNPKDAQGKIVSDWSWLDDRPVMIAIAGPNGAGKTTFYHAHVAPGGLPLVNNDPHASMVPTDSRQDMTGRELRTAR